MQENIQSFLQKPGSGELQQLLIEVAESEIIPRFRHAEIHHKADGSLVTDVDLHVQGCITRWLADHWPDIPLLGEEMPEDEQQALLEKGRFWCLDPVDGTTNFTTGLPFFAISLALVQDGISQLGLVYDPMRKECFRADLGQGAWLNDQKLNLTEAPELLSESLALVDLKRLTPQLVAELSNHPPYRSQRCFGAVALEWCWVAAGRAHLYLHGGQKPWDYAAGQLIFEEAGGCLGTEGACGKHPMSLEPQPGLGAVNTDLFNEWQGWLKMAGFSC